MFIISCLRYTMNNRNPLLELFCGISKKYGPNYNSNILGYSAWNDSFSKSPLKFFKCIFIFWIISIKYFLESSFKALFWNVSHFRKRENWFCNPVHWHFDQKMFLFYVSCLEEQVYICNDGVCFVLFCCWY